MSFSAAEKKSSTERGANRNFKPSFGCLFADEGVSTTERITSASWQVISWITESLGVRILSYFSSFVFTESCMELA